MMAMDGNPLMIQLVFPIMVNTALFDHLTPYINYSNYICICVPYHTFGVGVHHHLLVHIWIMCSNRSIILGGHRLSIIVHYMGSLLRCIQGDRAGRATFGGRRGGRKSGGTMMINFSCSSPPWRASTYQLEKFSSKQQVIIIVLCLPEVREINHISSEILPLFAASFNGWFPAVESLPFVEEARMMRSIGTA